MKSRFANTPYLVLFTVLIAVTVTSAYAITITLGGTLIDVLGVLNMNSNKITSLADPTLAQDAATKSYVDGNNFRYIKTTERIGTEVIVANGIDGTATVNCASGEIATGGGWNEVTALGDPIIFSSIPVTDSFGNPIGWQVDFSANLGSEGLQAIAICGILQNFSPLP